MPRIIENLESKLIAEAHRQVEQSGYGAFTIRSVATACGVDIGTVYNYFPSKDDLLAAHLPDDWQHRSGNTATAISWRNLLRKVC